MYIESLTLASRNVQAQVQFYTKLLGFECVAFSEKEATLKIGSSLLKFVYDPNAAKYHFAFNIPSNAFEKAAHWLASRVELIKNEDGHLFYFDFWNAYALYFYDADHNIVEYIARAEIIGTDQSVFCPTQVVCISEIGIPCNTIEQFHQQLARLNIDIPLYYGSYDRFCALGDFNGLFILVNPLKKFHWFPTKDVVEDVDFDVQIRMAENTYYLKYNHGAITLLS